MRPQTRYASSGGISIAYQVLGSGPFDLVLVHGWVSHLDMQWDEPHLAAFLSRLASFARLIILDKRGTGLSDRVALTELPTLEQRMDDLRAVMDAADSEKATLFGISEGGAMCLLFAATYPRRVRSVLTFGSYAKRIRTADYPWAPTREEREAAYADIPHTWGTTKGMETVFPSMIGDPAFDEWLGAYFRAAASPASAVALLRMNSEADIRAILPTVRVPALIMNRIEDGDVRAEEARYISSRIPGATLKTFPGADHVPWVGHTEDILGEIEEFLTGSRSAATSDRVLATILSTDIAGSTELVTRLGDRNWRELLERHHAVVRRELQRHGVHREIAAGQIGLDGIGERDVGLAGFGRVGLASVGRDLVGAVALLGADGAKALSLGPDGIGPAAEQPLDLVRPGIGGGVEIAVHRQVEQQISDGATDQVQAVPGSGEASR